MLTFLSLFAWASKSCSLSPAEMRKPVKENISLIFVSLKLDFFPYF